MRVKINETPNRLSALGIGCVVALSLHALVFSFLHMRDLRRKDPPRLWSRDNTPELLQFASQVALTKSSKNAMSLRGPELPPPAKVTTNRRSPATLERQWQTPGQPPAGPLALGVHPSATPPRIKSGEALSGVNAQRQRGSGTRGHETRSGTTPITRSDKSGAWTSAVERLRAMGSQENSAREDSTGAGTTSISASLILTAEGKGILRLDNESSLGRAYLELWGKAVPHKALTPSESGGMTSPVEVRRVPWRNVRASELPIRHGQVIIFGDKILLFWLQDDSLYLLQTTRGFREGAS